MSDSRLPEAFRFRTVFLASWILLAAFFTLWSLGTPVSAAPDEPAHIVKAASVVRGQFIGEHTNRGETVQVPAYIVQSHAVTCTAFRPERNASCSGEFTAGNEIINGNTTAGLYNPAYYLLVGWPSLIFPNITGIYAIRIVSGLLTSGLFAFAFGLLLAGRKRRAILTFGALTTVTPMVAFIGGVVNPSGPEIAGTFLVAVATMTLMLGRTKSPAKRLQPQGETSQPDQIQELDAATYRMRPSLALTTTGMALGAALAMNTRGISPAWVGLALAIPLLLVGGNPLFALLKKRSVLISLIVTFISGLFAVIWTLLSNSLGTAIRSDAAPMRGVDPLEIFNLMIADTQKFFREQIGKFGWLDTPAPELTYAIWTVFVAIVILAALLFVRGRKRIAVIAATASAIYMPAIMQSIYSNHGGLIWQGRYTLPALVTLTAVATMLLDNIKPIRIPRKVQYAFMAILCVAWFIAQGDSYFSTLRRYMLSPPGSWNIFDVAWAPPGGVFGILITATIVGIAIALTALQSSGLGGHSVSHAFAREDKAKQ